jgi:hypothetical protein
MFTYPCPRLATAASNPGPSSLTVNSSPPDSSHTRISTCAPAACLAAFCRASRQQKYTAASISDPYRPMPSQVTSTGSGLRPPAARSASRRPLSASSGG